MTGRYVALGSSMAAGAGLAPRASGTPFLAFRSAHNYPHLLAESLGLDLVDVTYAGATTANVLYEKQNGTPPQITVLNGSESLITATIGDSDVGYVPLLTSAYLPHPMRRSSAAGCGTCTTVMPATERWPRWPRHSSRLEARFGSWRQRPASSSSIV